jgi:hypothetical protein
VEKADLGSVYLVDGDGGLTHTEGKGEEGVLASRTILRDINFEFEFTITAGNDEESAVDLGGIGDHVLDEVTVTYGALMTY